MINEPKILLYDLETSHRITATFGLYNVDIPISCVLKDWVLFAASWKYLGQEEIYSASIATMKESEVIKQVASAVQSADIIIAHNGDKFDIKKLRTKAFEYNFPPFIAPTSVDTLKEARKLFSFTSNRLDYLAKLLGLSGKTKTSEDLWTRALQGDVSAVAEMERYCRNDVKILEDVYLALRGWMPGHPSVARLTKSRKESSASCPKCGSDDTRMHSRRLAIKTLYAYRFCFGCRSYFKGETLND